MSTTILPPRSAPAARSNAVPVMPKPKRWTTDEFHKLGDKGMFEGENLFLINGEILQMPAAGAPHEVALTLLDELIRRIFSTGYVIRCQMSLVLGKSIDPVPDLAVVAGSARDYVQKPTTAALIVEVSDSSLDYDIGDKASLYASAGVADYWVVDLVNRQLIVFRDPGADSGKQFGSAFTNITAYQPGQIVSPLRAPRRFLGGCGFDAVMRN